MTSKTIRDNLLLIAMTCGTLGYFILDFTVKNPVMRHDIAEGVTDILPFVLFTMLFLEFSKIEPRDLFPKRWIWMSFGYQILMAFLMIGILLYVDIPSWTDALWMGTLTCVLTPTATAVAVMSSKLGGKAASATTYAVSSSLFTAVAVPLLFPIVSPEAGTLSFGFLFVKIFKKVFPVIIVPLLISFFMRRFTPEAHVHLSKFAKDKSFYLWSICIMINTAQIVRIMCMGLVCGFILCLYIIFGGIICFINFALGKKFGDTCGDRISAGQSLGQKNTILAIWIAMSFLTPTAGIILGAYMIWQNLFNSIQLSMPRFR